MHVCQEEIFTFNRVLLATFQLRGLSGVNLFMRYFQDVEFLLQCQLLGGNALRHILRIPKDELWATHYRRRERGRTCFTNLQLKQICSRVRTPNEHFWGKAQFPGGTEAVEELAERVRDLRNEHGITGRNRRPLKVPPPHQYTVSKALVEVLLNSCRQKSKRKTTEELVTLLLEFVMEHPENCTKVPKTVSKLACRVESALINWRRPGNKNRKFKRGDRAYVLRWQQDASGKTGVGPAAHWLKLV